MRAHRSERVENGSVIELQYADALQNLLLSLNAMGNVVNGRSNRLPLSVIRKLPRRTTR